jgi:hypothetical protein
MYLIAYLGYYFGVTSTSHYQTERDTTTFVDTIPYYKPVPKDSAVVRYVTRYLPAAKQQDTLLAGNYAQKDGENIPPQGLPTAEPSATLGVEIPITQKHYESEEYSAYVSGYEPQLDSIFVFPKTTVIHERTYKPPNKWHIGITCGYGYGFNSKQAEPYIGIGITYSIFSF